MAWALQFDGVNDYCTIAPTSIPAGEDGSIRFIFKLATSAQFRNVFGNVSNNSSIYRVANTLSDMLIKPESATTHTLTYTTSLTVGVWYDYTLTKTSGVWDVVDTGTGLSVLTAPSSVDDTELKIEQLFTRRAGQEFFDGDVQLLHIDCNTTTANNRNWDATASSHASGTPVLTDTIGANNATGVNMPTDGSAWVNLGGSGTSGAITQTAQSFTQSLSGSVINSYTGTITQNTQSFTQSASGSITSEPITGVINQTVTAFTQSALGDVVSSGISGAINQTTSAFTQSATGSAVLNISGVISQTVSAFTQSLSGTVAEQISGTINQTVSSFTMSAVGRVPASWTDKLPASTSWADQTAISTIWTDK